MRLWWGRMRGPNTVRSWQKGALDTVATSAKKGAHKHTSCHKNQSVTVGTRECATQRIDGVKYCPWWKRSNPGARSMQCVWELPASPSTRTAPRSEEHTSELQSLMRISYAVFCLKKT